MNSKKIKIIHFFSFIRGRPCNLAKIYLCSIMADANIKFTRKHYSALLLQDSFALMR